MDKKILVGIPPNSHVTLALDEYEGLQALGYDCTRVAYARNRKSIGKINRAYGVIVNALKIVPVLYSKKPDILYLNSRVNDNGVMRDFVSILIFRLLYWKRLKIAIKSHGSDLRFFSESPFLFKEIVMPYLTKNVDAWLMLSEEEKENLLERLPTLVEKVYVIANIIDSSRSIESEAFKKKYNLDNNDFTILFVGRMIKDKGVYSIIKSIPLLEGVENYKFILVGDGTELKGLKVLVNELKIHEQVRFLGWIQEEECDHFFANCDALLFPSLDEGFSMVLFKSVANGLPIITTKIRAAKDHLRSPDNCLWVEGNSEHSVANAINTLYDNKELRQKMTANNIKLGQRFTKERVCAAMHDIFEQL